MDWEDRYITNSTPWDKGTASPPLLAYLARHPVSGRVLLPGCGRGHDVAAVATFTPTIIGLDISETAIRRAKETYPDLAGSFWVGDLFALPAGHAGTFDAIVEHTCLCALPPAMREAYRAAVTLLLKPGGILIGVWFINPEMDPGEEGPPYGISLDELSGLFQDSFEVIEDYTPQEAYEGREGRERLRVLRKR
jgi:SAM-dependent methyltransferase